MTCIKTIFAFLALFSFASFSYSNTNVIDDTYSKSIDSKNKVVVAYVVKELTTSFFLRLSEETGLDVERFEFDTYSDMHAGLSKKAIRDQVDIIYGNTSEFASYNRQGWISSLDKSFITKWRSGTIGVLFNSQIVKNPKDWPSIYPFCLRAPLQIMLSDNYLVNLSVLTGKINPSREAILNSMDSIISACSFTQKKRKFTDTVNAFRRNEVSGMVVTNEEAAKILETYLELSFNVPSDPVISWSKSFVATTRATESPYRALLISRIQKTLLDKWFREREGRVQLASMHGLEGLEYPLSENMNYNPFNEPTLLTARKSKALSDAKSLVESINEL